MENVHITLRRTLFWLFLLAFFAVGTLLIVKTQGFVFDWENLTFAKTGGVFVRSVPGDGKIFLDGKPVKKPVSLFNKGVLIKDLAPASYTVRVESAGRLAWEKTLIVEPGLVAAASFIRLFPDSPENGAEETVLSPRIAEDFWIVKGGIVEKSGGKLYWGEIPLKGTDVLESSPDRNEILTTDGDRNFYLISLSDPETAVSVRTLFASLAESGRFLKPRVRVDSVALHPFSLGSLIVRYGASMFALDTKRPSLELLMENAAPGALKKTGNEALWVTATGTLSYNLVLGGGPALISMSGIAPESLVADSSGSSFFAKNGEGTLFRYERGRASSTEIAKNVRDFSFSPSENRLLIVQNDAHALFYYLEEGTGDVKAPKGALKLFPLAKGERIQSAALALWNDDIPEYVFFERDGALIGAEMDIRSPVNAYALMDGVKKAAERDGKFIVLKNDGAITELTLEF